MTAYKKVVSLLKELSAQERQRIVEHVKALNGLGVAPVASPPSTAPNDSDLILEAIRSTLIEIGIEFPQIKMLKTSSVYNSFSEKVDEISKWIGQAKFNLIQKKAFFSITVKLLYEDLRYKGVPSYWNEKQERLVRAPVRVGSRELMIFIHMLPSVVDRHFPGYMRGGVLHMIIRNQKENVRKK